MGLALEDSLRSRGFRLIAGVDEVGRGALAGPLVACAVVLAPDAHIEGLRDSKLCTSAQRERLAREIRAQAVALSIVRVPPASIDRHGLHRSNLKALRRALVGLPVRPDYALSDGYPVRRPPVPALGVKKGDQISPAVAAASIVAKVFRDRSMVRLDRRFPVYGFRSNKGYGTPDHRAAIAKHGPSAVHRMSFAGVNWMPAEPPDDEEW